MKIKTMGACLLAAILLIGSAASAQMGGDGMMKGDQTKKMDRDQKRMKRDMMGGMMHEMMGMMHGMMESMKGMAQDPPTKQKMDE
ncbi:MAG TPA: hypothetical protein VIL61_01420, partial [Nitrospiria bacterium]